MYAQIPIKSTLGYVVIKVVATTNETTKKNFAHKDR